MIYYNGTSVPKPTCQLASVVSQCQSQWETYASSQLLPSPTPPTHCDIDQGIVTAITQEMQPACASTYQASLSSWRSRLSTIIKPPCAQASVGGGLCSTIKDAYVHQQNSVFFPNVSFAPYFSNGCLGSFANITAQNYTKSWWWPTSSTLGVPGCTLGCGRCAVTGGTVQLIYWPEATQDAGRPEQTEPVTISTLGTVFTSPTYYISYKSVFASDGCSAVGPTHYNTIVPIPGTEQLSSVFGGTLPCVAHVHNAFTQEWTATASFNGTDMNEPVPFSIYSSQPWCATYQFEHGCKKACPTTEAYQPIIVVPEVVLQNMDTAWASCYGDIRGVYDPPLALQQAASIKGPQMTVPALTTIATATGATPASVPSQLAAETATALALSDTVPLSSGGGDGQPQSSHSLDTGNGPKPGHHSPQGGNSGTHTVMNSWQNVGGMIASILGGAGSSSRVGYTSSQHLSQHLSGIIGPDGAHTETTPTQHSTEWQTSMTSAIAADSQTVDGTSMLGRPSATIHSSLASGSSAALGDSSSMTETDTPQGTAGGAAGSGSAAVESSTDIASASITTQSTSHTELSIRGGHVLAVGIGLIGLVHVA